MDLHVKLGGAIGVRLVALDASAFIIERLVDIILHGREKIAAGINRQTVAVCADVLVKRQSGLLGADIP